jgi:hypothetical protein
MVGSSLAAFVALLVWWKLTHATAPTHRESGSPTVPAAPDATAPATDPTSNPDVAHLALQQRWDAVIARTEAAVGGGPGEARTFVRRLFAALDQLTPSDRLAAVRGFLLSGRDVRFGRAFGVGAGGFLQDWPTLRVALFDYLAQRDGAATRELAISWLKQRPAEAGEWTLAMRELARGRTADQWTPELTEALRAFVSDPDWSRAADPAWLEGFDVVVAGRSAAFLPDLARVAADAPTRPAKFAGFLAADRLMLIEPEGVLAALNGTPELLAEEPNVRAGLFARADVRESAQRRALEFYFQRNDVSEEERTDFGRLFPLYDLAVSQNLLTPTPSRPMSDMLAHDRATLRQIDRWLADARFHAVHEQLRTVADRLNRQLAQAAANGMPP